jgi:hypothetical protein
MNRHQQRVVLLFGLLLLSAALLGCASNERVATATAVATVMEQDIARARAMITEAEETGAAQFAGPELTMAREKVRAAEQAAGDGDVTRAARLAVEAGLDAELAMAIARNRETQALAAEVESGLRTLEAELRRTEGAGFGRL